MKVTDPVCSMTIESSEAVGTLEHRGTTYYFCSQQCQQRFAQDPTKYNAAATHAAAKHGGGCC